MRYIPTFCLREGMVLAKTIYNTREEPALKAGSIIKESYIEKINAYGLSCVYIDDDISSDIIIEDTMDELRIQMVKGIKNIFSQVEENKQITPNNIEHLKAMVGNIIDELLENKNLMVNMGDLKVFDNYTFYHSVNVAVHSITTGITLHYSKEKLYQLGLGALFHDIGKVFIDKAILNKNDKLTDVEFDEMKQHSERGYKYLKEKFNIPIVSYIVALQHHEKYDGTGYPQQRREDEISVYSRIVSIADVYDALTSDRPYRKSLLPSEAVEYIMGGSGSLFDPKLASVFVKNIAPYPIGTTVRLSNGLVGIVAKNFEDCCMRPIVKIIKYGNKDVVPFELNLKDDIRTLNITIVELVNI